MVAFLKEKKENKLDYGIDIMLLDSIMSSAIADDCARGEARAPAKEEEVDHEE